MPITYPYVQYGGIWTTSQATDAVASGTWAVPPTPKLYAWGQNNSGQLGLGNRTYYSSPKQVGSLTNWNIISTTGPSGSSFGIKTDGTLWSWGVNATGALGLGNITYYSSPKQVGSLTNWASLASGGGANYMLAIKTDGTLWSWGWNNQGQLGLGNTNYYSSPVQVGALTTWKKVYSEYPYSTFAIKTDGTLWSWGNNAYGQLGLGSTTAYSSPKQVGLLTNWVDISPILYGVIGIKTDGTLWSWGRNQQGQLGLGNITNYSSPKQIGSLTTWGNVSGNGFYYVGSAIKTDGTLWSWGYNVQGQLGLGNTTNYSSPKQVGSLTNWKTLSTSSFTSTLAIKTDGTLWGWGANSYGCLGFGNTSTYNSPKQVGSLTTWLSIAGGYNSLAIAKT